MPPDKGSNSSLSLYERDELPKDGSDMEVVVRLIAYTDFWQAYKTVILPKLHRAVGKETGLTNHIERLNNTFRQ